VPLIEKIKSQAGESSPFIKKVLQQLKYPSLIAAVYGLLDWYASDKSFSLATYLKLCAPALFFIMWLIAMYERERKKTYDKEALSGLSNDIQSLKSVISELGASRHASMPTAVPAAYGSNFSQQLLAEADAVFKSGHKLAALLQAGVAFEQAVRSFAVRKGLAAAERMPLLTILQKIDFLLPQGWQGEIHMLRKIRNQLAHASKFELADIENAEMVFRTYGLAIEALESSRDA
jgi:cbb3-type cytochrome oxidase subunit 3